MSVRDGEARGVRAVRGADVLHLAPNGPGQASCGLRRADRGLELCEHAASRLAGTGRRESLQDVIDRVRPCWDDDVVPLLHAGRCVLVVAHGNSLRALCSIIDDLSAQEVESLNLPAGQPLRYDVALDGRLVPRAGRYLDARSAHAAAAQLAREGGT